MEDVRQIFIYFLMISPNWLTLLSPASPFLTEALQQGHKRGGTLVSLFFLFEQTGTACASQSACKLPRDMSSPDFPGPKVHLTTVQIAICPLPSGWCFGPFSGDSSVVWNERGDLTGNPFLPGRNAFLWQRCKKGDGYLNNTGSCRAGPESMYCIAVRSLVSAPTSWSSLTKASTLVIFRSETRAFF